MHDDRQNWMLVVAASLAGGAPVKRAIESADQVRGAFKSRWPRGPEYDK